MLFQLLKFPQNSTHSENEFSSPKNDMRRKENTNEKNYGMFLNIFVECNLHKTQDITQNSKTRASIYCGCNLRCVFWNLRQLHLGWSFDLKFSQMSWILMKFLNPHTVLLVKKIEFFVEKNRTKNMTLKYASSKGSFLLTTPPPPPPPTAVTRILPPPPPHRSEFLSDWLKLTRAWLRPLRCLLIHISTMVRGGGGRE